MTEFPEGRSFESFFSGVLSYPGAMEKLSSKLIMELKPGAQVISNTFEIPTWTPSVIQTLEDVMCPQIFYYKMERAITSIHQLIDILYSMIV